MVSNIHFCSACAYKSNTSCMEQIIITILINIVLTIKIIQSIYCVMTTFFYLMPSICKNVPFLLAGVRTEQDLYIRLIDSMTKQVSCCYTLSCAHVQQHSCFTCAKKKKNPNKPCKLSPLRCNTRLLRKKKKKKSAHKMLHKIKISGVTRRDSFHLHCLVISDCKSQFFFFFGRLTLSNIKI